MSQEVTNMQQNVSIIDTILDDSSSGIQATTRIDRRVKEKMEKWLSTDEAREHRFYSNSDFVTKAVSDALDKYMTPPETPSHFILPNRKDHALTLDFDVYNKRIVCNMCSSETCIHIQKLKTDRDAKKYLKEHLERRKKRVQTKSS